MSQITVLVGSQWGDEGKGKWVDILSEHQDIIARFQGGNNAGHTLYINGQKIVLHQLPSGIFQSGKIAALLSGVVINPTQLALEIDKVGSLATLTPANLWLSDRAHVITPFHVCLDERQEAKNPNPIGTTKRGIGPTYSEKINRSGLRMGDYVHPKRRQEWVARMQASSELFADNYATSKADWEQFHTAAEKLAPFVNSCEAKVRSALDEGRTLLLEGAQGTLLDINHGTYPYVTSSSTTSGGAVISLGIDPRRITNIYGIAKAYVTRVGEGPFPTELTDEVGKRIAERGQEFGATTKRPRRCGWFDAVAMRYAIAINGLDCLYVNKMDILSGIKELKIATAYDHPELGRLTEFPADKDVLAACKPVYETYAGWSSEIPKTGKRQDLPAEAQAYIAALEEACGIRIAMVGSGPARGDFLVG